MWSWVAHRVTGVLIFFFLFAHVLDTALVRVLPEAYNDVIGTYKKQMEKARQEYAAAGERGKEQVAQLDFEIQWCAKWLPKQLDESELREAVAKAVAELPAKDPKMAGKPDEMIDKIAVGKLNAFFKENTLTAQAFVKDASRTVGDYLKSVDASVKVTQFKRVQLG